MFRVPFLEACEGCGGFAEIETEQDYLILNARLANLGDIVSCSVCECTGVINSDRYGKYCDWDDELCDICLEEFEEMLEGLAEEIIEQVKGVV